ncbi:hypothetical protein PYCCODRAFT_1430710 [Trametes coccinea BRFM310]|uniref:Uncharacterized protein n=1 Tax=Trametes coccinea (strain BRFM310) TaxID=1353009 RepID=A0A1Y2J5I8_TRAC3|nr:hypothetical protein PYCCODRAFT_1430710 [Trametes coccinea BRFM310]
MASSEEGKVGLPSGKKRHREVALLWALRSRRQGMPRAKGYRESATAAYVLYIASRQLPDDVSDFHQGRTRPVPRTSSGPRGQDRAGRATLHAGLLHLFCNEPTEPQCFFIQTSRRVPQKLNPSVIPDVHCGERPLCDVLEYPGYVRSSDGLALEAPLRVTLVNSGELYFLP